MSILKGIIGPYMLEEGRARQIGTVVKNLQESVNQCKRFFGDDIVLNYFESEPQPFSRLLYRGKPSNGRCKICTFQINDIEWELIEPDEMPSAWREALNTKGEGLNHIGYHVSDLNKVIELLKEHGMNVIQEGYYPRGYYAYIDANDTLGTILEFGEERPEVIKQYEKFIKYGTV